MDTFELFVGIDDVPVIIAKRQQCFMFVVPILVCVGWRVYNLRAAIYHES
jgi:hypothetical protein